MTGSEANVTDPLEDSVDFNSCAAVGSSNIYCRGGAASSASRVNGKYATGYLGGLTYTAGACAWGGATEADCFDPPEGRHLEGANYVMADGHAKWFKGSKVSPGGSAATPNDSQTSTLAAGTANSQFAVTFSGT
jgi:prepilin-type processing-associated H-X9-DG protein